MKQNYKLRRFLCIILSALIILPTAVLGGSTESEREFYPGEVLYQQNFDNISINDLGYQKASNTYSGTLNFSTESGRLQVVGPSGTWGCYSIYTGELPKQYTIRFDLQVTPMSSGNDFVGIRVGEYNAQNAVGDWVQIRESVSLQIDTYGQGNNKVNPVTWVSRVLQQNTAAQMAIEVDTELAVLRVYVNGTLVCSYENCSTGLDGVYLVACNSTSYIDDLSITAGSLSDTAETRAGEILYAQNFDLLTNALDAGWTASATGACNSQNHSLSLIDDNGDRALSVSKTDGWNATPSQFKIVDGSVLAGVKQYTVQYVMRGVLTNPASQYISEISLRFGAVDPAKTNTGEMIFFASDGSVGDLFKSIRYGTNGEKLGEITYSADRCAFLNRDLAVAVEVDTVAGTVSLYLDGKLINTRTGASETVGDIYIKLINATVSFDNIVVSAGTIEDVPVNTSGVQTSTELKDGERYSVRFVGTYSGITDTVNAVGFQIVAHYGDNQTQTFDRSTSKVYTSLNQSSDGISKSLSAKAMHGDYLYGLTVTDIPISVGSVRFSITPYYKINGIKILGKTGSIEIHYNQSTQKFETVSFYGDTGVPSYTDGTVRKLTVGGGADMVYAARTSKLAFASYLTALSRYGFEKYTENTIGSSNFATYIKQGLTVNLSFDHTDSSVRIVMEKTDLRPARAEDVTVNTTTTPLFTQVGLSYSGSDPTGMSYFMRLADGRYLVFDGGLNDAGEVEKLYQLLKEQCAVSQEPVIAAWFLTHAHIDHYECFLNFAEKYQAQITIESVVCNLSTDVLSAYNAPNVAMIEQRIAGITDTVIYARTGQRYHIGGAVIEVLYTPDDIYPAYYTDPNNASVVYRVECAEQSILILGDALKPICDQLAARYGTELKSTMLQVAHHGYEDVGTTLYKTVQPEIVLWPTPSMWYEAEEKRVLASNKALLNATYVKKHVVAGYGTTVLELPYTP